MSLHPSVPQAALEAGDHANLGRRGWALREALPRLHVLGGSLGHRHAGATRDACPPAA